MVKKRVLIVDDSVVMRALLSEIIAADPRLEVVGVAANGKIAIEKLTQLNPDIVTLDVEMPVLDGISTLKELKKIKPKLPVIIVSALTEKGAQISLEALANGAADCVAKPTQMGNADAAKKMFREQIIPKIYTLCSIQEQALSTSPSVLSSVAKGECRLRPSVSNRVDLVVIGVSTGGPNALEKVITKLPDDMPVPVALVQHMPPVFTKSLAERLDSKSKVRVYEAEDGVSLLPGIVYIAPGGRHITINKEGLTLKLKTNMDPPENSCRPAVDVLFRSAVDIAGPNLLAVIMTGMGQDGFRGCELVAEKGGQVIVQDEASSVVWGMPGFVARAGLAEKILPVGDIADEIVKRAKAKRLR
ncbi:MAG: chemotaxis response regulator protein-glutamate methylesterase [Deltaproteobacteria bacterium]|nr:chemotaxis response regulator protein-glutamate methylesterase [Deltaproteobacteria bacterium]